MREKEGNERKQMDGTLLDYELEINYDYEIQCLKERVRHIFEWIVGSSVKLSVKESLSGLSVKFNV